MKGKIHVNQVDLHYVEQGSGPVIVFIHGNLADYRSWQAQVKPLARTHRVITYSRRYNYPNQNKELQPSYSAAVDAEDLAALIQVLGPGPVHLIGQAYGALVALILACEQPALVRSLVVAEPPVLAWLADIPEGPALYTECQAKLWQPVRQAFCQGNSEAALRLTLDYLAGQGALAEAPLEYRQMLGQNLVEWEALASSQDPFPLLARDRVRGLAMPLLLMTGENSPRLLRLISAELERLVPHAERTTIPQAGHRMWDKAPEYCREAVLKFLGAQ